MKQLTPCRRLLVRSAVVLGVLLLLLNVVPVVAAGGTHVVQRGENLSTIAVRYGVDIASIMQANSIRDPNVIYIGQQLNIPSSGSSGTAPAPSTGSTVIPTTVVPSGCPVHRVSLGDTLGAIGLRYGVTVEAIQRANGLGSTIIWPGLRLKMPCSQQSTRSLPCALTDGRYLVRPGDTLGAIAMSCNTTVSAIKAANRMANDIIYAGTWIRVSGPLAAGPSQAPVIPAVPHFVPGPVPAASPTRTDPRSIEPPTPTPAP